MLINRDGIVYSIEMPKSVVTAATFQQVYGRFEKSRYTCCCRLSYKRESSRCEITFYAPQTVVGTIIHSADGLDVDIYGRHYQARCAETRMESGESGVVIVPMTDEEWGAIVERSI